MLSDISDHLPILICFDRNKQRHKPKQPVVFKLNKITDDSIMLINNELSHTDWNEYLTETDAQESYNLITDSFQDVCLFSLGHGYMK